VLHYTVTDVTIFLPVSQYCFETNMFCFETNETKLLVAIDNVLVEILLYFVDIYNIILYIGFFCIPGIVTRKNSIKFVSMSARNYF